MSDPSLPGVCTRVVPFGSVGSFFVIVLNLTGVVSVLALPTLVKPFPSMRTVPFAYVFFTAFGCGWLQLLFAYMEALRLLRISLYPHQDHLLLVH